MDVNWCDAKRSSLAMMTVHLREIEQEIAAASEATEKAALQEARIELMQAMFAVYLMTE